MINITAPINNLGYGIASYNIIKNLLLQGNQVNYLPIGKPEMSDPFIQKITMQECHEKNPSVKIWHQHELHGHVGKGMHVGFPIFELERFNELEKQSIKYNDRIFTCTIWAKEIVEQQTGVETKVVPLGVDTQIFKPHDSTRPKTVFFNCGKWEVRKGHDILVNCFNAAFDHSDEVELWMMCSNPFYSPEQQSQWEKLYKESPLGDKIRIIPRQNTHRDVYNVMKQADCGVFPARAEGWNLELLEMMACGKHVIATEYSAHTEFCNTKNCHLVSIDNLEPAQDGVWFHGQGSWASLGSNQLEQVVTYMRAIHTLKQEGNLQTNIDGIYTAKEFSWENSAKKFIKGLE